MSSSPQTTFEITITLDAILGQLVKGKEINVLDIASGYGKNGATIKQLCLERNLKASIVGVDIWMPYIRTANSSAVYDALLNCDARNLPFKQMSFNLIIATEIIEHMNKDQAIEFLRTLESFVEERGIIIISTPQGQQEQDELDGNNYQIHKSVWTKRDMDLLGYNTEVSPLVLRTPFGRAFLPIRNPTSHLKKLKNTALLLLSSMSYIAPSLSGKLIAYKIIEKRPIDKKVRI